MEGDGCLKKLPVKRLNEHEKESACVSLCAGEKELISQRLYVHLSRSLTMSMRHQTNPKIFQS